MEFSGDKIVVSNDDETDLADFAAASDENVCDAISCDFEKGDLCQWEASNDEISPDSPHYRRKHRKAHYVRRTWHNWQGRYRNRVTGIARARELAFHLNQSNHFYRSFLLRKPTFCRSLCPALPKSYINRKIIIW